MILDGIRSPHDVGALDPDRLPDLAHEIREEILRVCAANGGHLAASLGSVDIAVRTIVSRSLGIEGLKRRRGQESPSMIWWISLCRSLPPKAGFSVRSS